MSVLNHSTNGHITLAYMLWIEWILSDC